MAAKRTRSSLSNTSSVAAAKPFRATKRKKPRDFSATEQEELLKNEIKGRRFAYRLRSVRNILKTIGDDASSKSSREGNSGKKARRRSKLKSGKRKSIVDTVLLKNFQLSVQEEKADDPLLDKIDKETKESDKNFEERSTSNPEKINSTTSENEEKSTLEKSSNSSGINKQNRSQIIPEETAEELLAKKESQRIAREKTLENIKLLQKEQEKWVELYEKYQKQLSDAQQNTENGTLMQCSSDGLSETQEKLLADSIDAKAAVDRLISYQNRYAHAAKGVNNFYQRLHNFEKDASEFLQKYEANELPPTAESETPRRLITKFIQGGLQQAP